MGSIGERLRGRGHWVAFVLLEVVSVWMTLRLNAYQNSVWTGRMTEASGMAAVAWGEVGRYVSLGEENRRLTHSNIILERSNRALREEVARLRHVPSYTELRLGEATDSLRLIEARVCGNSVRQADNLMLINRGWADGVRREQGVLSGTGVVGIVSGVGRHYSTVIPILNSHSSISCRLRGKGYFGYLHWEGGNPLVAILDDVPHHAVVRVGDAVETSGFSNIFPEGIFVGRVVGIANSADGQALRLRVQLSTDLSKVGEVMVVVNDDEGDILDAVSAVPQGESGRDR